MKNGVLYPLLLASVAGWFMTGCSHVSMRTSGLHPRPLPPEVEKEYACPKGGDFDPQVEILEQTPVYVRKQVMIKPPPGVLDGVGGTNTERRIGLDYYDLRTPHKTPVVLVLPMAGGGYAIERHFANYFANHGYAAVIVHREKLPKEKQLIENLNPMMLRMVLDHKRVIDWLETQPDIEAGKIGLFGISLGGIKAAILTPLENRIQASMIGLAGGDVPYLLAHSTEPGLVKRREEFLKKYNLTLDEAEVKLRTIITRDPLAYAPYVDPQRVLMVIARYDTVVPTEKGLLLKEKMGNPETIMLPSGHYTAVLSIPYIKSEAFEFFEKRFQALDGKPATITMHSPYTGRGRPDLQGATRLTNR
jgi:hypothetical protein